MDLINQISRWVAQEGRDFYNTCMKPELLRLLSQHQENISIDIFSVSDERCCGQIEQGQGAIIQYVANGGIAGHPSRVVKQ